MNAVESDTKCYRLQRSILFIGLGCTPLFASFGVASAIAAYWNLDGSFNNPTRDAIICGGFWLGMSLLSTSLIGAYFRCRLYVSDSKIEQAGFFLTALSENFTSRN